MRRRLLVAGATLGLAAVVCVGLWLGTPVPDRDGISLSVSMDPDFGSPREAIRVLINVRNNLGLSNDPPVSYSWPVENMSWGMCANGPVAIAVYRGNVSVENASSGRWSNIFLDFHLGRPMILAPGTDSTYCPITHSRFLPFTSVTRDVDLKGEYGLVETSYNSWTSVLNPFPAGAYTLFVGDLWGHLVTRHFSILA